LLAGGSLSGDDLAEEAQSTVDHLQLIASRLQQDVQELKTHVEHHGQHLQFLLQQTKLALGLLPPSSSLGQPAEDMEHKENGSPRTPLSGSKSAYYAVPSFTPKYNFMQAYLR
jgi:hypothetical protein